MYCRDRHRLRTSYITTPYTDFSICFDQAIQAARKVTGAKGYLAAEEFQRLIQQGRINQEDLLQVIDSDANLQADQTIAEFTDHKLQRRDVLLAVLSHPFKTVTGCQLNWQIEEFNALSSFQSDVAQNVRAQLLKRSAGKETEAIAQLWSACLEKLDLAYFLIHPEELTDLSPTQAEEMLLELDAGEFEGSGDLPLVHQLVRHNTNRILKDLISQVGSEITLRGLLLKLTGHDLLDEIRPQLIRFMASWLDLGIAAWHNPDHEQGFYAAWRQMAQQDKGWVLDDLPEWRDELEILPDQPIDVIFNELKRLGLLPEKHWAGYLENWR